ncbi:MAG: hypothetical protein KKB25_03665 [Nanoarchaeota archaeon]|nr:hypothetical protein [Nanoarchaeota archaeon]
MRIEIRKKRNATAVLISFDTDSEKFESLSERNRFFWGLHGRRQTVVKNEKRYEYEREGLLDKVNHIKVADSVFIIAMEHMKRMMEFFDGWDDKVEVKIFPVLLGRSEAKELKRERAIEIE